MSGDTTPWIIVLGDPVAQARIVTLFNVVFDHLGIRALAVPRAALRIDAQRVADCFNATQVVGVCTTSPAPLEDGVHIGSLSASASRAAAVSAVRRDGEGRGGLQAELFDGIGFVRHLQERGFDPAGKRALIYGAGAEGAALGFELARRDALCVDYRDWNFGRAHALSQQMTAQGYLRSTAEPEPIDSYDLVVCNSAMSGPSQSIAADSFRPGMWVADTCLWTESSPLLERAAQAGARTFTGIPFLRDQVSLYLSFFAPALRGDAAAASGIFTIPSHR